MSGDKISFDGPGTGSIITIRSTLVTARQSAGRLPGGGEAFRLELQELIGQLQAQLESAPAEQAEAARTVAVLTEELTGRVEKNAAKPLVGLTLGNLKQAGSWLMESLPMVPKIIDSIEKIVDKIV